ncbi:hypothetical protein CgunFtcFv8_003592 [Champsocephalus gunnari]|uniref:Uncharacterized protein n=1 Tax=Champsocephalus gunnari TaxID=52237 RepID=A0AAN8E238_CHAGU|nr:hypothetical protein CgunFtcFv8_003592 [Champsocephalus gunnari]
MEGKCTNKVTSSSSPAAGHSEDTWWDVIISNAFGSQCPLTRLVCSDVCEGLQGGAQGPDGARDLLRGVLTSA